MSLKGFSSSPYYQDVLNEIGQLKQELSSILDSHDELRALYRAQGGRNALDDLIERIEQAEYEPEPSTEPDYR